MKALDQLKGTARQAKKADIGTLARSLAFVTVFAIVPLFAVVFAVFKLIGGLEATYYKIEPYLLNSLSSGAGEEAQAHLLTFIRSRNETALGWIAFAGLLFTAITTYQSVNEAFVKVWEIEIQKKWHHRILRALLLITLGPILLALSLAVTTAVAAQISWVPGASLLIAYILSTMLLFLVYSTIPAQQLKLKNIFWGSCFAALLWEIGKSTFAIYTGKILGYSKFYGGLAAIPLLLTWIYIGWYIIFLGAAFIKAGVDLDNDPTGEKS